MGLPDRDYYLLDKYKPQRDAYRAYIERTLELIGDAERRRPAADRDPGVRDRDRQAVAGQAPTCATSTSSTTR